MSRHRKKNEINRILSVYNKYMAHSRLKNKWSISNKGNRIIYNERKSNISKIIHDLGIRLTSKNILDVGCAGGNIFNLLQDLGAKEENIYGIDVRGDRLEEAKELFPASNFMQMDARELNFDDATFDIVFTFTIFSSIIEKKIRMEVANEICRVLKPNGVIIYYDIRYNNPFNSNVIKMTLDDQSYADSRCTSSRVSQCSGRRAARRSCRSSWHPSPRSRRASGGAWETAWRWVPAWAE